MQGRSLNGYEMNRLWRNDGDGRFTDVSVASGAADIHDARGFTACDFDRDGDLDLYVRNYRAPTVYLRNEGVEGHWLTVRPHGTTSNRDAIGTKITVVAGGRSQIRWITAGSGYLSQMPNEAYFGLGDAARVDRIVVRWPDGREQVFGGVEADRHVSVVEGSAELTVKPASPQSLLPSLDSGRPDPILAALAAADLRDLSGARFDVASLPGPRHVVFWAPWCNTCRSEFAALNDLHRAHRNTAAGVLAIAVLDDHGPAVEETIAQLKPEFPILTLPRADYDRIFGQDAAVPRAIVVDGTRVAAVLEGRLRPYLVRSFLLEALRGR
ncbi:MAG: ASPIC/UnbV domain-containing protein [Planctomycetes bacterium]|nr:ASPIC/UnbV domain-containing protein [Planctomycetota bacterium]